MLPPPFTHHNMTNIEEIVAERGKAYGSPFRNHTRTARLWNAYLANRSNTPLSAEDVCFLNILQKVSRAQNPTATPSEDTLDDIAGYALNIKLILEEREEAKLVEPSNPLHGALGIPRPAFA